MELPTQERATFLTNECRADEDLRREVESLLAADHGAGGFLATGALSDAAKMLVQEKSGLLVDKVIGRYQILSLLGSGGMGDVYLAEDTRLKRQVAIKFLPDYFASDLTRLRRFEQEARAASALNHPNILTIYEIGEVDSARFIVTEFIDGITLRQRITQSHMDMLDAIEVSIQVASALVAAHKVKIVHRDIKPENIMVRRDDALVKVLDFGLAKATEKDPASAASDPEALTRAIVNTSPGVVMGTVAYMSPEQARGQPVDERTDIWSVGVVLYEMLTGRVPFTGASANEVISNILSKDLPSPLARFMHNVPAELERIVSKALRKEREQRYQTTRDLMLDLQSLKQQSEFELKLNNSQASALTGAPAGTTGTESAMPAERSPTWRSKLGFLASQPYRRIATMAAIFIALTLALFYLAPFRTEPDSSRPEIRSLVVLPLDNLSGDSTQDYFADGMTEELIASLSKIGTLRVISRTSSMQYRRASKPLKEIARELNVDAVVEGSVLRSGDRVRITVQLIHGATDRHLWAESYQRDVRDILALQSELGRAIANEIKITLTPQEQGLFGNARSLNPAALEEYLQGRDYFNQGRNKAGKEGNEMLKTSITHFQKATAIQPDYALAYAGSARAHHWLASNGFAEFFPRAKEEAMRALRIDETLAEAHGALGYTLMTSDRDWTGSEKEFQRAIALNPSYSEARHGYALYLSAMARHDKAIAEIVLAHQLDPLTGPLTRNMGSIYLSARQYDRAIEHFQRLRDATPNNPEVHGILGRAYVYKGMYEEGIVELKKQIELAGGVASRSPILAWAYAVAGNRSEAIKILEERLKSLPEEGVSKVNIASVYVALGNHDEAFVWLEKARAEGSTQLIYLNVNPSFDNLRSDPRFAQLVRRVGFNLE